MVYIRVEDEINGQIALIYKYLWRILQDPPLVQKGLLPVNPTFHPSASARRPSNKDFNLFDFCPCFTISKCDRVPTRTGKPGKIGRHFPVREKSGNFEKTGKVRENHTKYWKTQGIWDKYYLIFLVIFKWTVYYLPKWIKFSVWKKKNKT